MKKEDELGVGEANKAANCEKLSVLQQSKSEIRRPKIRILEDSLNEQFTSNTWNFIQFMLNYLWEDPQIFRVFRDEFLPAQLTAALEQGPEKAAELLDMVVTHLFVEPTLQVQDWRVVELSQGLIARQVAAATKIEDLESDALLGAWFGQLGKSNEAKRAIHYMFKNKCEKIDIHYLTWRNVHSKYEKYLAFAQDPAAEARHSIESAHASALAQRVSMGRGSVQSDSMAAAQADRVADMHSYRQLFKCLIDIADVISAQIFEKVSSIPYAIRQFCKCLYQSMRQKFGATAECDRKAMQVVAHYLLENWMLKAVFQDLDTEGLCKDFYLTKYCRKNLQLALVVLYKTMTF